jgi:hypothetical protein
VEWTLLGAWVLVARAPAGTANITALAMMVEAANVFFILKLFILLLLRQTRSENLYCNFAKVNHKRSLNVNP